MWREQEVKVQRSLLRICNVEHLFQISKTVHLLEYFHDLEYNNKMYCSSKISEIMWTPNPRKLTQMDEFRNIINKRHGVDIGWWFM